MKRKLVDSLSEFDIDNKVDIIYAVCVIESRKDSQKKNHKKWYRLCRVYVTYCMTEVIDKISTVVK